MNLITSSLLLVHADEEEAMCHCWKDPSGKLLFAFSYVHSSSSTMCTSILQSYMLIWQNWAWTLLLSVFLCFFLCLPIVHLLRSVFLFFQSSSWLGTLMFLFFFFFHQTLFKVWNVFLMDGLDVLLQIALGILRSNEAQLLRCESVLAVYVSLKNLPTRMWEADKLLQVRPILLSFFNSCTVYNCIYDIIILVGSRSSKFTRSFTDCWQTKSTCCITESTHFLEAYTLVFFIYHLLMHWSKRKLDGFFLMKLTA